MEYSEEDVWLDEQRATVIEYLAREGVNHGGVGDWPAWHVHPYVAIWAIESGKNSNQVGWWAISGDLPTDYTTCRPEVHPRTGLQDIADRWLKAAPLLANGEAPSGWTFGDPNDWPSLAPLVASRAELLMSWVADEDMWQD